MGGTDTGRSDVDEEADHPTAQQEPQPRATTPAQPIITTFRGRRPDIHRSHTSRNAAQPRLSQPKLHRIICL
jgi:hypothetical protein